MAGDDAGDDVGEAYGSTPLSLAVSTSEAMVAQCSPPPSEPAKRAFFRLRAIGLIERSTTLESISTRPSSRKRPERVPDCFGELALLADQGELLAQPWLEGIDDGAASLLAGGAPLFGRASPYLALDLVSSAMRWSASVAIGAGPDWAIS
ncbi:hypothetical protein FHS67_006274 [Aminobacter aminovorans]|uniref:Uncharacterized protein n=1 Tax=Aminobacter aminovorans TaxID=83263 RepID=A0ABR6HH84_AMIAI|nr:hypothetical protein [Aminobacter aminovorans]